MFHEFMEKSTELLARGERFAVATVVRCQAPSSGKPGDKGIILADGSLWGWIGGGCAQPAVVKEGLKALADGRPRLVRISPSAGDAGEGVVDYSMTCHSGGELDIYIEPVLPLPHVVIVGRSPVAQALAQLAGTIGYRVEVVADEVSAENFGSAQVHRDSDFKLSGLRITPQTFVVVSTQGHGDEEALEQAAQSEARYVAFVASKTKSAKVFDYLESRGAAQTKLDRIKAPAGLNINAATPQEIAVSILAEIVQVRGSGMQSVPQPKTAVPAQAQHASPMLTVLNTEALDPICKMTVDTTKAKHKSEYHGKWFYFCCAGCKQKFEAQPEQYVATSAR
ncbi:MAG TPA: XdhC family protein [Candidatus Limnocylindrales bacterium]|nr:XdhC family protein [Candidatus Limnocylindrales bacterium]